MAWEIRYDKDAYKQLKKMDQAIAKRVIDYMDEVSGLDDPRSREKGLAGNLAGLWRYRIGNYRVICDLVDEQLVVVALAVDHRSKVYTR